MTFPRREDRSPDSDDEDMSFSNQSFRGLREESLVPPGAPLLEDGEGEDDEDIPLKWAVSSSGSEFLSDEELRLLPQERRPSDLSLASGEPALQERQNSAQRPRCSTPAPKVKVRLVAKPDIVKLNDETTKKYWKGERLEPAALAKEKNINPPSPSTEIST
jgi:hypothetical protein